MTAVAKQKKTIKNESERIIEMRKKIRDELYMDCAIHRIALVLSKKLVENHEIMRK